jgi:hypothetical protein
VTAPPRPTYGASTSANGTLLEPSPRARAHRPKKKGPDYQGLPHSGGGIRTRDLRVMRSSDRNEPTHGSPGPLGVAPSGWRPVAPKLMPELMPVCAATSLATDGEDRPPGQVAVPSPLIRMGIGCKSRRSGVRRP